jgi:hypothetical protein
MCMWLPEQLASSVVSYLSVGGEYIHICNYACTQRGVSELSTEITELRVVTALGEGVWWWSMSGVVWELAVPVDAALGEGDG